MTRWSFLSIVRAGPLLSWLIGLVGRQQSHDQPYQLTRGEHERPLMTVCAYLMIFAIIVGGILRVAHPDRVGRLTEVVAEKTIAGAG
jgi:hypothetical protein